MNPKCLGGSVPDTFDAKNAHLTGLKMIRITRAVSCRTSGFLHPPGAAAGPLYRTLSLRQKGRKVLGTDLKCSESRRWPAPHCASNQTSIAHGERLYGHVETAAQVGPLVSSDTA